MRDDHHPVRMAVALSAKGSGAVAATRSECFACALVRRVTRAGVSRAGPASARQTAVLRSGGVPRRLDVGVVVGRCTYGVDLDPEFLSRRLRRRAEDVRDGRSVSARAAAAEACGRA
jgi:hypothetical protein